MSDTRKDRVRRVLFAKRKQNRKISRNWHRRRLMTLNGKLREAIMDVLPFDVDKEQADLILETIFESIAEAIYRGETLTLPGIGKFYLKTTKARYKKTYGKQIWIPERQVLAFTPAKTLMYKLVDEEPDGTSGRD